PSPETGGVGPPFQGCSAERGFSDWGERARDNKPSCGSGSMDRGSSPPTNVRTLVLRLSCGISFVLYLHRYTLGFIKADLEKEFHWDAVTFGWLDGLFPASYGLAQIPSGIVCDWFGAHVLLG